MMKKFCHKCGSFRNIDDFFSNKTKKDGHSEKCRYCYKDYYLEHKKEKKEYDKIYHKENLEKYKEKRNMRKLNDIKFKIAINVRKRLCQSIRGRWKSGSSIKDLGCSVGELKKYLESKFQNGMSWDNWGRDGWHIDHIKALANFDLTNREQFLVAVNYKNLQPLWAVDNLSKGNR